MTVGTEVGGGWAKPFFDGRTVLVTGGTSGIGAGIAGAFLQAGARVVAVGVGAAELERARAHAVLSQCEIAELDVRDRGAVEALVGGLDTLDVAVNCAGIIRRGEELDPDVFASVLDINLTGTMRVCHAAREKLAATGGSIVNLASMLSFFGGGLVPGYAASKGGIAQLTKSLAIAYAGDGIRVNAIAPGWIETPLTRDLVDDPQRAAPILQRTAMKRWGQPADLTGGVLFLASPAAAFVTGVILPIDGGYAIT